MNKLGIMAALLLCSSMSWAMDGALVSGSYATKKRKCSDATKFIEPLVQNPNEIRTNPSFNSIFPIEKPKQQFLMPALATIINAPDSRLAPPTHNENDTNLVIALASDVNNNNDGDNNNAALAALCDAALKVNENANKNNNLTTIYGYKLHANAIIPNPLPTILDIPEPVEGIWHCPYTHTSGKPCEQGWSTRWRLLRHILPIHIGIRYQCEYCNHTAKSTEHLKVHVSLTHRRTQGIVIEATPGNGTPALTMPAAMNGFFHCPYDNCNEKFSTLLQLQTHADSVHLEVSYKCPTCSKLLKSTHNAIRHYFYKCYSAR